MCANRFSGNDTQQMIATLRGCTEVLEQQQRSRLARNVCCDPLGSANELDMLSCR